MADTFDAGLPRRPVGFDPLTPQLPAPTPLTPEYAGYLQSTTLPDMGPTAVPQDPNTYITPEPESAKAFVSGVRQFGSVFPALYGLGANVVSPHAGDEALRYAAGMQRRAQAEGPAIQSYKDVHDIGDAAQYAVNTALEAAPDLALAIGTGGVGGAVAKAAVRKAALNAAEDYAVRKVGQSAIGDAAAAATDAASEQAAKTAAEQAVAKKTAEVAPRFLDAADKASGTAEHIGRDVGVTAGMFPGTAASGIEGSPDANGNMVGGAIGASPEDTLKYIGGSLLASGIGAALPSSLLGQATKEVADTTQRLLPRVAKEAAKQGAVGAAAGVGQAAATIATHKWINDNVDLLSPQAVNAYVNSALGGGVLGAGIGAGIEGARAIPGAVSAAVAPLRAKIREGLAQFAEMRNAAYEKAHGVVSALRDQPTVDEPVTVSANDAFNKNLKAVQDADVLDADTERLSNHFESGAADAVAAVPRAPAQNPYALGSRMQDLLATFIPHDAPIWGVPDTFKPLMASAEKLVRGQPLEADDFQRLDILRKYAPETVTSWEAAAPELRKRQVALDAIDRTPDEPSDVKTSAEDASDAGVKVTDRAPDLRTSLREQLTAATPGTPEHADLQSRFRDQLLNGATFDENRRTPASRAAFEAKLASPTTVETTPFEITNSRGETETRRRLIQLDNLLQRNRAQRGELTGDQVSPHDALLGALGDLHLAGVEVKPESLTPGDLGAKDGESLGRITPNDVASLRGQLPKATGTANVPPEAKAARIAADAAREAAFQRLEAAVASGDQATLHGAMQQARQAGLTPRDIAQRREQSAQLAREPLQSRQTTEPEPERADARVTREPPPTYRIEGQAPNTSQTGVHSVQMSEPYKAHLNAVIKARGLFNRAKASGNAEAARAAREALIKTGHEQGLKIAQAELARSGLNERRIGKELARLSRPENAREVFDYVRRAERGEFNTTKVHEQRPDLEREARVEPERSRKEPGTNTEGARTAGLDAWFGKLSKEPPTTDAITQKTGELAGKKTLTPNEQRFIAALREATQDAAETNPLRRALDAFDETKGNESRVPDADEIQKRTAGSNVVQTSVGERKVDRTSFDVPYLGSSLKDGTVVLQRGLDYTGKTGAVKGRDLSPYLIEHEAVEAHEEKKKNYTNSHEIATTAEHAKLLEDLGLKPGTPEADRAIEDYEHDIKPLLAQAEAVKNPRVPPDIIEKPYDHPHNVEQRRLLAEVQGNKPSPFGGRTELSDIGHVNEPIERSSKPSLVEDTDFTDEAGKTEGPTDHAKLTDLVNAVLKRMGITDKVTVLPMSSADAGSKGQYVPGSGKIYLSDSVTGAARIETLAHELGHHIMRSELARAMGVKLSDIAHLTGEEIFGHINADGGLEGGKLAEHLPELHKAIGEDFKKWFENNSDPNTKFTDALASRKPYFRSMSIEAKSEQIHTTLGEALLRDPEKIAYLHSVDEYVADQISRALTNDEAKSPVATFFKGIADKLKLAYESLFGGKGGEKYAAAPSVEKWVSSLFDRTTLDVSEALGRPVTRVTAENATRAAAYAAMGQADPKAIEAMTQFVKDILTPDERSILDRAINQGRVTKLLFKVYANDPTARRNMLDAATGLEHRIAYAYDAYVTGRLKMGGRSLTVLNSMRENLINIVGLAGDGTFARRILDDIASGRIESLRKANKTYDVRAREAAERGIAQKALNAASKVYADTRRPLAKVFSSSIERIRNSGVPALRQIGALLHLHTGEAGDDAGLISATTHNTDVFMRKAAETLSGLSPVDQKHFLNALQQRLDTSTTGNAKVDAAIPQMRALFARAHAYARNGGLDIGHIEKFFPVVMDVSSPAKRETLKTLLSDPKFERDIRSVLGSPDKPRQGDIAELIQNMVDGADGARSADGKPNDDVAGPRFRSKNFRLMDFIYKKGTPEQIAQFASLQSKDPARIFSQYIVPMVKEVESVRRFGKDDVKLNALLDQAKKQGASPAQIEQVKNAVDGARGRIGIDGSPVLRNLIGEKLADKIANPKTRSVVSNLQAYQNVRLLPLSLLSSLVDPMGIAVRTGGDFKTAWGGFKLGMKSLYDKQTKEEVHGMLQSLGSAHDFFTNEILSNGFGDTGQKGARKINDALFKYNGLEGWTRTTRYMALQAAHGFLLKHAARPNDPKSQRYLDELGVKASDIQQGENGRVHVHSDDPARDERVRQALLRFVDEAILRPNSQQSPNWMADPYLGLVSQYKAFAYSLYDQIGGRILHEVRHGNAAVLGPTLAYLPIVLASEMLRSFIQYGPGGNPQRKDWGPEDYTNFGLMRTGLLGPKVLFGFDAAGDRSRGALPGSSFLGPTYQQAGDVVKTAVGRRSTGATIEESLPGESVYRHWNDEGASNVRMQRKVA